MPDTEPDTAIMVRKAIGSKVRGALAEHSKTQRDLGEHLSLPQSAIALRLDGIRAFKAEELVLTAQWLGVAIDRFVPDFAAEAGAA